METLNSKDEQQQGAVASMEKKRRGRDQRKVSPLSELKKGMMDKGVPKKYSKLSKPEALKLPSKHLQPWTASGREIYQRDRRWQNKPDVLH